MKATELQQFEGVLKSTGFFYIHHQATESGYIRKDFGYIERYKGRFGIGFKIHYPNSYISTGNKFHAVTYLIEKNR